MRYLIVGTAGHIDHGKSALVRALTGIDPDRLKEEKERGITIDLGFADVELDERRVVSFVDVPGHERFVRHMVAGATGIDCVLLVIAADEGVRPQTREHLSICTLLDVRHGLLVLTKCDLVDEEIREVVELEVREFVQGTFLENARLLPVSARTGDGLDDLRLALAELCERVPERPPGGVTRLPVDRSFVLRGFGTVVTGTLASGSLAEGDEVQILPGGARGRVRGLQVHRRKSPSVRAGQRVAANLQGLDRTQVPRGATVTHPGALPVTRRVWARLRLLESAPDSLAKGGPVRFHQGTCERAARLRVLGRGDGPEMEAEIHFHQDAVLLPGDRFILRRPAPVDTVGGGVILDVRPPARGAARAAKAVLAASDPDEGVLARLDRAGASGMELPAIASEMGLASSEAVERLARLEKHGDLVRAGTAFVHAGAWKALEARCVEQLSGFHAREPLRSGMSREELRSRVSRGLSQDSWRILLDRLAAKGEIRLDAERVSLPGHEIRLSPADRETADRIDARFRQAGLDPPDLPQVIVWAGGGRAESLVAVLVEQGRLVRIRDGRLFHADALEELRRKLRDRARTAPTLDVAAFKDLARVTRKNAIPLLEQMDEERVTRRVGNLREILAR